jgi:hypothetical protein
MVNGECVFFVDLSWFPFAKVAGLLFVIVLEGSTGVVCDVALYDSAHSALPCTGRQ